MVTIIQLLRKKRKEKRKGRKSLLGNSPQKKGVSLKVFTISPRKPNSAVRKVVKVRLSNQSQLIAYIPGESHELQEHANVLVRGGGIKDLSGVNFTVVRGVFDCSGVFGRKTSRSKYGTKR